MKKRVEKYLKKSRHFRIIETEATHSPEKITYTLMLKWSLINLLLFDLVIELSLGQVDKYVTLIKLRMHKSKHKKFPYLAKSTWERLENLVFIF